MSDLKPCPSCREPMDHPSGDGCANMTAHKERAVSDEKCCGACGYPIYATKESACDWCRQAADRIEALTKERDEADDLAKAAFADGASNNIRLAETSYRVKWLEAKLAKAVEALERIAGVKGPYSHPFPESYEGYGAFAIVTSRETLEEIKGESHE